MTERKKFTMFVAPSDQNSVDGYIEIDPHEVRIYDYEGDLSASFSVPSAPPLDISKLAAAAKSAQAAAPEPSSDIEFEAIRVGIGSLQRLDGGQRERVLDYLQARFK